MSADETYLTVTPSMTEQEFMLAIGDAVRRVQRQAGREVPDAIVLGGDYARVVRDLYALLVARDRPQRLYLRTDGRRLLIQDAGCPQPTPSPN